MVDSVKNATAVGTAVSQTQAGDSLRKNLKSLSPVSVSHSRPSEPPKSDSARAESALAGLSDSVHLSADAIRTLVTLAESSGEEEVDLVEENIRAASATPEDVQVASESAQRAGANIHFNREEALEAHGNRLSAQRVQQLLTE